MRGAVLDNFTPFVVAESYKSYAWARSACILRCWPSVKNRPVVAADSQTRVYGTYVWHDLFLSSSFLLEFCVFPGGDIGVYIF